MKLLLLSLLLGCSGAGDGADGDGGLADGGVADGGAADGGVAGDGAAGDGGLDPSQLNGTAPAKALPLPEFAATNRDGAARDREDLLGSPTVMWFYPKASTAG